MPEITPNSPHTPSEAMAQPAPEAAIEAAIARSTGQLQEYANDNATSPHLREDARKHVLKVAGIVRDNPEHVAADMSKPPQHRTEFDPERAHLIALTIDKNMTRLAADKRLVTEGKDLPLWRRKSHESDLLGAALGEALATDAYNADPVEAGPAMVAVQKDRAIEAGNKAYKNIKGAKSTKI